MLVFVNFNQCNISVFYNVFLMMLYYWYSAFYVITIKSLIYLFGVNSCSEWRKIEVRGLYLNVYPLKPKYLRLTT